MRQRVFAQHGREFTESAENGAFSLQSLCIAVIGVTLIAKRDDRHAFADFECSVFGRGVRQRRW